MTEQHLYDQIGAGYSAQRRADPRWVATIRAAIGDVSTVLNVGAGTGSYEPTDVPVIALDPSTTMLRQRSPTAAPAVAAQAEAIPFGNGSFDCAIAILTLHHWTDWRRGLSEIKRVARRRIIILTAEMFIRLDPYWLIDYFPGISAWDQTHMQPLDAVVAELPPARVVTLPVPHDCTDGFCGAYWRRPRAYLDPAVRSGISGFSQISAEEINEGLARLERDLESGRWEERYGGLLEMDEIDIGYRMVIAER